MGRISPSWGMRNFAEGIFLSGGGNPGVILTNEPFSKLKTTFCKYSASVEIKFSMTNVYNEYEVKRLQLKI